MDAIQTSLTQSPIIFFGNFCQCIGSAIRSDSFDLRQTFPYIADNFQQPFCTQHHSIGVLQKDCLTIPFCEPCEYHLVTHSGFIGRQFRVFFLHCRHIPIFPVFVSKNHITVICHGINILFHFCHRTRMEIILFIKHTKLAFIPRTVFRYPQQQTVCLTGRTDGSDLKHMLFHILFSFRYFLLYSNEFLLKMQ